MGIPQNLEFLCNVYLSLQAKDAKKDQQEEEKVDPTVKGHEEGETNEKEKCQEKTNGKDENVEEPKLDHHKEGQQEEKKEARKGDEQEVDPEFGWLHKLEKKPREEAQKEVTEKIARLVEEHKATPAPEVREDPLAKNFKAAHLRPVCVQEPFDPASVKTWKQELSEAEGTDRPEVLAKVDCISPAQQNQLTRAAEDEGPEDEEEDSEASEEDEEGKKRKRKPRKGKGKGRGSKGKGKGRGSKGKGKGRGRGRGRGKSCHKEGKEEDQKDDEDHKDEGDNDEAPPPAPDAGGETVFKRLKKCTTLPYLPSTEAAAAPDPQHSAPAPVDKKKAKKTAGAEEKGSRVKKAKAKAATKKTESKGKVEAKAKKAASGKRKELSEAELLERKAKLSRKSSAYHVAKRKAKNEGCDPEEVEKRAKEVRILFIVHVDPMMHNSNNICH